MGGIIRIWRRLAAAFGAPARPTRKLVPAAIALEGRRLPAVSVVSATVAPAAEVAQVGRLVPVEVSGVFRQVGRGQGPATALDGGGPSPGSATVQVVDEERSHQPSGPVTLVDLGGGDYAYRFTLYLEGSRSASDRDGRRYLVTVAGRDAEGSDGRTIPVTITPAVGEPGRLRALIPADAGRFDQHAQSRAALAAHAAVTTSHAPQGPAPAARVLDLSRRSGRPAAPRPGAE